MLRSRNFDNDERMGQIGENILRSRLMRMRSEGRIQFFTDDTKKPASRRDDIDFHVVMEDGHELTYECKTDAYGLKTRNITYEITSRDYAGCLGRSNADYIHYVFVDSGNNVVEEYAITLHKWRNWLGVMYKEVKPYKKGSGNPLQLFYSEDIGVLQFLCNIDRMVEDGVAKRLL